MSELANGRVVPKMDHLACFLPGLLALGAMRLKDEDEGAAAADLELAKQLAATCWAMYSNQPTGARSHRLSKATPKHPMWDPKGAPRAPLTARFPSRQIAARAGASSPFRPGIAPEFVRFDAKRGMYNGQNHNLLRPETAESLFILWRVTKDPIYREQGWAMFLAFDRWCRVEVSARAAALGTRGSRPPACTRRGRRLAAPLTPDAPVPSRAPCCSANPKGGGFAGLRDVTKENPPKDDTMQSFWLAETLKYLYLLFADDDKLDLTEWVFTTEAHPIRVMSEPPTAEAIGRWAAAAKRNGTTSFAHPR